MSPPIEWARFDDCRSGRAHVFDKPSFTVTAWRTEDVVTALADVQRATENGWWAYGFVSYEAAAGLDPTLQVHEPTAGIPLVWFAITTSPRAVPLVTPPPPNTYETQPWQCEWNPTDHADRVERIRTKIGEGLTYQCNLTTRLHTRISGDLTDFYANLALGQRGSYNAFLDLGRFVIASASPELFFELRGDRILMRPMKGTASRGRDFIEDTEIRHRLQHSDKERAENIMIVDLVRNDLARLAAVGSVTVSSLCRVERYETVHQLTSEVSARLLPETGLVDIFRALFPCGSITGAPKHSTMQLIHELEPTPRGVYCGAVGFVGPPDVTPRARFSVAIRTAVIDRDAHTGSYGSGGGITWSSTAAAEYAEVLAKAKVLAVRPTDFVLYETMRTREDGTVVRLDRHLRRLQSSADFFGFHVDLSTIRRLLRTHHTRSEPSRITVTCNREGDIALEVTALPQADRQPVLLAIDDHRFDSRECWGRHKTSRRARFDEARSRYPHVDDVVVVNEQGNVAETTNANIAVLLDGCWWTPPLDSGCLPGIERAHLIDSGKLTERELTPDQLRNARSLALVSTVRGWRPATLSGSRKRSNTALFTDLPAGTSRTRRRPASEIRTPHVHSFTTQEEFT